MVYLIALGLALAATSMMSDTYDSTCLVRLQVRRAVHPASQPDDAARMIIDREYQAATSEAMLTNIVNVLDANAGFVGRQREYWQEKSSSERLRWLKDHLRVILLENAYVMRFMGTARNAWDAADIANAAATAYREFRSPSVESLAEGVSSLTVEIMEPAVPGMRPNPNSSPLAEGLTAGFGHIGFMLVGAAVGFIAFLVEKVRRATLVTQSKVT